MSVEADLHAEGAGQLLLVQAMQTIDALVERIQFAAALFVRQLHAEWLRQPAQVLQQLGVSGVDALGQVRLLGRQ